MTEDIKKTDFGIKLTGEFDGVDATTFIDMLGNLSVAIHQINDDIQSDKSLKIIIKHLQPGCYDIFLSIKETFLDSLLAHIQSRADLSTAAEIVGIVAGLVAIRQFLKGGQPEEVKQEGNESILINGDGNNIRIDTKTYNIFREDKVVDSAIAKSFEVLDEDDSVEGFEIYDNSRERLCSVPRNDFKTMALPSVFSGDDTREKPEEAILTVFKVVFAKGYKWQFYYQGNKISATIEDEDFYKGIDDGDGFAKGDKLIVDLLIKQVYDKTIETYINKEYIVTKIKRRIPREKQKFLPLGESAREEGI